MQELRWVCSRAGRIMDMLEAKGVVGPVNGSKPEKRLIKKLLKISVQDAHRGRVSMPRPRFSEMLVERDVNSDFSRKHSSPQRTGTYCFEEGVI